MRAIVVAVVVVVLLVLVVAAIRRVRRDLVQNWINAGAWRWLRWLRRMRGLLLWCRGRQIVWVANVLLGLCRVRWLCCVAFAVEGREQGRVNGRRHGVALERARAVPRSEAR
jgi:hypothetical protein